MTKPALDTTKPLVMASFKTVLGHNLNPGTALTIVDEPSAAGEVDLALATRLWNSGVAAYLDDHRPTPVETPDQEKARLAAEAARDAGAEDQAPVAPKIGSGRKKTAGSNPTNSETDKAADAGSGGAGGSTGAETGEGADTGAHGDG